MTTANPQSSPSEEPAVAKGMSVLALLRREQKYCDCIISAGGEDMPAHINIVSYLAPFFATALNGDFHEGKEKRVTIRDATARSVEILLDYAYEMQIADKLDNDLSMIREIWALAHRFEVKELERICGRAALKNLNTSAAVEVFQLSKLYNSETSIVNDLFEYIAHHFGSNFEKGDSFAQLTPDEMMFLVSSPELVTDESNLVDQIYEWVHSGEGRMAYSEQLLANVHFELFTKSQLEHVVKKYSEWLPKSVLLKALVRNPNSNSAMDTYLLMFGPTFGGFEYAESVQNQVVLRKDGQKVYFTCYDWTMSVRYQVGTGNHKLSLQFERRTRMSNLPVRLLEEAKHYKFRYALYCRNVSDSSYRCFKNYSWNNRVVNSSGGFMLTVQVPEERTQFDKSVIVLLMSAKKM